MSNILVIDDDIELCELLTEYLVPEGLNVTYVQNGEEGIEKATKSLYELVILDVMLPEINGFDILHRIRLNSSIPVIMLTARGEDVDRIVGLEMGADDYLPKPFNPRELIARIRAILRRSKQESEKKPEPEQIVVDDIQLNTGSREVLRDNTSIDLTAVEFSLLEVLVRSAGHVVSREELVKKVLGRAITPYDRSIDVHVSNLRKKLGRKVQENERIKTIRGSGYLYTRLSDPAKLSTES